MRDNDGKSETLALIKKVPQQRSHENETRKGRCYVPSVSVVQKHKPLKNMESAKASNDATSFHSSATVAVQRHQVKRMWSKPHLNSGLCLLGQGTINVRQSTEGRVSNIFVRWDIFQMQSKVFTSHFFYLFQLLIHERTPTTAIFPGCSESHVLSTHRFLHL